MKTEIDTQNLKKLRQTLTDAACQAAVGSKDYETNQLLHEVEKTLDMLRLKLFNAE